MWSLFCFVFKQDLPYPQAGVKFDMDIPPELRYFTLPPQLMALFGKVLWPYWRNYATLGRGRAVRGWGWGEL